MHVLAAFESNLYVEMALEKLKSNDIEDNRIVVVEMKMNTNDKQIVDTIYHSNGISLFDSMAAWAVMGATLGCVYGSILRVGPVILGLSGAFLFATIGFLIDLTITKSQRKKWRMQKRNGKKYYDILIIIRCNSRQEMKMITSLCENNHALFLGGNE